MQYPLMSPDPSALEVAFLKFHRDNPNVYETLVAQCHAWRKQRGPLSQLGIKMLWERLRWVLYMALAGDEEPRLSNNHHAFYARLIDYQEGDLHDPPIFKFRKQEIECSFWPRQNCQCTNCLARRYQP